MSHCLFSLDKDSFMNWLYKFYLFMNLIQDSASIVRANMSQLNPPVRYRCKQPEHLSFRVEARFRTLPVDIMSLKTIDSFKNEYKKVNWYRYYFISFSVFYFSFICNNRVSKRELLTFLSGIKTRSKNFDFIKKVVC